MMTRTGPASTAGGAGLLSVEGPIASESNLFIAGEELDSPASGVIVSLAVGNGVDVDCEVSATGSGFMFSSTGAD